MTKLTADFDKLDKNLSNLSDGALILVTKTSMICLHQLHHHAYILGGNLGGKEEIVLVKIIDTGA